jgi:hypothetical protein
MAQNDETAAGTDDEAADAQIDQSINRTQIDQEITTSGREPIREPHPTRRGCA